MTQGNYWGKRGRISCRSSWLSY